MIDGPIRRLSDAELANLAATLCGHINDRMRGLTLRHGFANAHRELHNTVRAIAPGWDWIETTEVGDSAPTVSLIDYR